MDLRCPYFVEIEMVKVPVVMGWMMRGLNERLRYIEERGRCTEGVGVDRAGLCGQ